MQRGQTDWLCSGEQQSNTWPVGPGSESCPDPKRSAGVLLWPAGEPRSQGGVCSDGDVRCRSAAWDGVSINGHLCGDLADVVMQVSQIVLDEKTKAHGSVVPYFALRIQE